MGWFSKVATVAADGGIARGWLLPPRFGPTSARAPPLRGVSTKETTCARFINGSKPALVVAALVAVVGITGTAYAGKSPGSGSKGDAKQTQSWSKNDKNKGNKWDKSDKWDKGDKADKDPKTAAASGVSGVTTRVAASPTASRR